MKHRIGIITDVHGNDEALKEVLKILSKEVDEIICLGDLIGIGPNSNEVLDIIRNEKNISCVLGNHDRYYLYGFDNPVSCTNKAHQDWIKKSISKENGDYLKKIPLMIERVYNNKKILFIHYGYRDLENMKFESIAHDPSIEDMKHIFRLTEADIYFFGHEHKRGIVKGENREYICVGSLGCPYPHKGEGRYAILEVGKEIKYDLFTFNYDSSKVVKVMIDKNMPDNEFIRKNFYCEL